ncbi:MAG: transcription termination/antitermination NusG family protein [Spirochaetota bacterium]|jgi:transcriptional antiterminator NusG
MRYFAIQVATRHEDDWLDRIQDQIEHVKFHKIMKKMYIRKRGKTKLEEVPLFPGYIFFEHPEEELPLEVLSKIRHSRFFIRFLPSNEAPRPLDRHDSDIIRHFVNFGSLIPPSLVKFDENQKIKVVQGPLQGIEGFIVKLDRRKHRAKVRLTIAESVMILDLSFEVMESDSTEAEAKGSRHAEKRVHSV